MSMPTRNELSDQRPIEAALAVSDAAIAASENNLAETIARRLGSPTRTPMSQLRYEAAVRKNLQIAESEIRDLQSSLKATEREVRDLRRELMREKSHARDRRDDIRDDIAAARVTIIALRDELTREKEMRQHTAAECGARMKEIDCLKEENDRLKHRYSRVLRELVRQWEAAKPAEPPPDGLKLDVIARIEAATKKLSATHKKVPRKVLAVEVGLSRSRLGDYLRYLKKKGR